MWVTRMTFSGASRLTARARAHPCWRPRWRPASTSAWCASGRVPIATSSASCTTATAPGCAPSRSARQFNASGASNSGCHWPVAEATAHCQPTSRSSVARGRRRVSLGRLYGEALMAQTLVIVESAAKCRTIQHYLGAGYLVRACFGHVRDLPTDRLGVDVDRDFAAEYVVPTAKASIVKQLRA